MSIIFGLVCDEGAVVDERQLRSLAQATDRYAPDGSFIKAKGRVGMGFQPYLTHERSKLESQPWVDEFGNMIAFDGRLDNHQELCELLEIATGDIADSLLVLKAFRKWSEGCFAHFTGDWSLALWSGQDRSLYLARDHAGTRSLYFERVGSRIRWSTFLESFFTEDGIRPLDASFAISYIAGLPAYDRTPYKGIQSVTPAHFVRFQGTAIVRKEHWQWLQEESLFYSSDGEYEEHFVSLFRQAVERRTGAGSPILAELSGGMDSTAIVCMSDQIRNESPIEPIQKLDTVSYYDDSEPNWNEKKYFEITERHRGKYGVHLCVALAERCFQPPSSDPTLYFVPGGDLCTSQREVEFQNVLDAGGYRVVLSGLGGDEVLGGVPTSDPELGNYLVSGHLTKLLVRSFDWCLIERTPILHQVFKTARYIANVYQHSGRDVGATPKWLGNQESLEQVLGDGTRPMFGKRFRYSPSALSKGLAWWAVMSGIPNSAHNVGVRYEYRFPYLDKDLVNFLYRIPRTQIVRPGRRRSLMRRALKNTVPLEILERPRKGFIRRASTTLFQAERERLQSLFEHSNLEAHGLVDKGLLERILHEDAGATEVWSVLRAGWLELWLQSNSSRLMPSSLRPSIDARSIRA